MQNSQCIELFEKYLSEAKKASANTLSSYLRDVRQLGAYLETHTDEELDTADEDTLAAASRCRRFLGALLQLNACILFLA